MSENTGQTQGGAKPIIVRGRITKIDAEKFKDAPIAGIELGVEFDGVTSNGAFLEIKFTYHAFYKEDIGRITMAGFLMFEMDEVTAKRMSDKFAADREFEPSFMESVVNNINYKCSTEAIFPAKILELTAPIVPPRIGLRKPPGMAQAAQNAQNAQRQGAQGPKPADSPVAVPISSITPPQPPAAGKPNSGSPTGAPKSPFPFPPSMPPSFKS
ncbi:MAG: hypothetical protein WCX65_10120 [bacterium]